MNTLVRRYTSLALLAIMGVTGCKPLANWSARSQSPGEQSEEDDTKLVGDWTVPFGLHPIRVEAVGLVTKLKGTGSEPGPSPRRAALVDGMNARGVKNPNTLLASKNVSLVVVRGYLPPGIQKGDRFDVEVRVEAHSETSSLRGGWLMETRMTETLALGDRVRKGNLLGVSEGPVMIDPAAEAKHDKVMLTRGKVLGGGVAKQSRSLGIVLTPKHQHALISARIANAVNKRFHTYEHGVQVGVAKAQNDKYIGLTVHPRYKDNIARYVNVVRAVAIQETDAQRVERIARLQKKLLDPRTAADAALQLEALGPQGVEPLQKALASSDTEVRFYAAEALAYLDRREAAEPLGQIAHQEPAFRVFALTALSAMDDVGAAEQLRNLLDVPSAETRYGAYRALWAMKSRDPVVRGERLGDQFNYCVLDTIGPPMVHVTNNRLAEVVLFGKEQRLLTPLSVNAGNEIMVTSTGPDEVSVARFVANEADQKRTISTRLDEVIRAIAELGGNYPDVVQALQEAKTRGGLVSRFEVDALPQGGRTYTRAGLPGDTPEGRESKPKSALPELYAGGKKSSEPAETASTAPEKDGKAEKPAKSRTSGGFFGKMFGGSGGKGEASS